MNLLSAIVCRASGLLYDLMRSSFPPVVRIETTNACNARCVICPHRTMGRAIAHMEEPLFCRIADECAENSCEEIHLHNFGEPLLDRRLEDRIRYIKESGHSKVKFFSNGALLKEDRIRGLIDAGLDEIKISIDGADREEFERIRYPLKFDRVVGNIRRLSDIRNELKSPLKITVACCSTKDKSTTMQMLEAAVDKFSFGKIHNWASQDYAQPAGGVRKPCSRLWRTFTILANGDVSLCCLDYDGQQLLGRVDEETGIRDIWNGEVYRRLRGLHKRGRQSEIHLCSNCTKSFLSRREGVAGEDEQSGQPGKPDSPAVPLPLGDVPQEKPRKVA